MSEIREFILERLQREYTFKSEEVDEINYMDEGYMDSLGVVQFIAELEDRYQIEFTDEELFSPSFRVVGRLIALVESKVS